MRPLLIFDYANPHYDDGGFPNSPEAIAAFGRYAVHLARATQGLVHEFEVWNEWVGGCGMQGRPGDHSPEAYGRLLRPTYAAVKQAFSQLTVVGIGGEYGADCAENVTRALAVAGPEALDGWSIHPYRYPRSPEESDLVGEVKRIAGRVAAIGATQKVWITEIGYPTHRGSRGTEERTQARLLVRTLALVQASGLVERAFWYDFKDDGLDREEKEHNFGLVHHQRFHCAPKPGAVALSQFIRATDGARFEDWENAANLHAVRYRRADGKDVVLAWTDKGARRRAVTGRIEAGFDLVGAPFRPGPSVELTESPVYLIGEGVRLAE
jgi:hypothetical protein